MDKGFAEAIAELVVSAFRERHDRIEERLERIENSQREILKMAEDINQEVQDAVTQAESNFADTKTALTGIANGVLGLDTRITTLVTALQTQEGSGQPAGLSQASKDALAALVTDSTALKTQAQGISTADPSVPVTPA